MHNYARLANSLRTTSIKFLERQLTLYNSSQNNARVNPPVTLSSRRSVLRSRHWLTWSITSISTALLIYHSARGGTPIYADAIPSSDPDYVVYTEKKSSADVSDKEEKEASFLNGKSQDAYLVDTNPDHSGGTHPCYGLYALTLTVTSKVSWSGLDLLHTSLSVNTLTSAMSSWQWPITFDFSAIQARVSTLLLEISRGPGSLYSEIVDQPPDPNIYPEVEWDAEVRLGEELCIAERAFLGERRRVIGKAFAQLMGVSENEVDERDIPIVAIAGSGGGLRAMLNTTGSLIGAESTGILSCATYTAGVSGSCWALGVLHSGVAGAHDIRAVAQHLKDRIQVSYLDTATLDALVTPPTNKYLLAGLLRKATGPLGTVSLVNVYGILLGSRIFVPANLNRLDPQQLSLHFMRRSIDQGQLPLPIFTAIQHMAQPEISLHTTSNGAITIDEYKVHEVENETNHLAGTSHCLWYEFTPYEIGCDELGAWIPSWSLGRRFKGGKSVERCPELGFTILSGIFGSAFCASLKLYFKEVQPTLELLPAQLYGWLLDIVTENERDLALIHPVLPDQVPNFLKGLSGRLRRGSPANLTESASLGFMDAGAELNIPYYPLLRRNVDCIIALDASADSQDLWFTRAEELAIRRGLETWPRGARWPQKVRSPEAGLLADSVAAEPADSAAHAAARKLAIAQESELVGQTKKQDVTESRDMPQRSMGMDADTRSPSVNTCEVWIGSSKSDADGSSHLDDLDEESLLKRDGIGVVYIPLAPNESGAPGFDPFVVSTWRREVTPEESQALLDVAQANFENSAEKISKLLRAIWLRKKNAREHREWMEKLQRFGKNLRSDLF